MQTRKSLRRGRRRRSVQFATQYPSRVASSFSIDSRSPSIRVYAGKLSETPRIRLYRGISISAKVTQDAGEMRPTYVDPYTYRRAPGMPGKISSNFPRKPRGIDICESASAICLMQTGGRILASNKITRRRNLKESPNSLFFSSSSLKLLCIETFLSDTSHGEQVSLDLIG